MDPHPQVLTGLSVALGAVGFVFALGIVIRGCINYRVATKAAANVGGEHGVFSYYADPFANGLVIALGVYEMVGSAAYVVTAGYFVLQPSLATALCQTQAWLQSIGSDGPLFGTINSFVHIAEEKCVSESLEVRGFVLYHNRAWNTCSRLVRCGDDGKF